MEGSKKKQKEKTKSSYSLRELTPEITGISKSDYRFDAEYKAVQRIVKVMKKLTNNNEKNMRISKEEKDSFVIITRNLYYMTKNDPTGEGQELFSRMAADEKLTVKEYDKLIKLFKEGFEANPDLPLYKMLLDRVNNEDNFYQLKAEIEQQVNQDINFLFRMESSSQREKRAKEYLAILKESSQLNDWREDVKLDLQEETEILIFEMVRRKAEEYFKKEEETDL
ncbi:hypothetical protein [Rummeliibacillus stabekisii]|uniref:Uncharacterized protein n=1 Tax=Rummeliibacillus stabekisii TaxID=241244 RepID=A0A143H9G4_9BACL|nr:hypothetical protein [Rummeliibacillus stabekisii]AMW97941.1 hypothetical protein ATY39_00070 [Rummeliibacillus stabekisii]